MEAVKKYDLKEITIRLNNLKKILGEKIVEDEVSFQNVYRCCDNWCDVLNLAYRALKQTYCKIYRHKYGFVRQIEYERRKKYNGFYTIINATTNTISTYSTCSYATNKLTW